MTYYSEVAIMLPVKAKEQMLSDAKTPVFSEQIEASMKRWGFHFKFDDFIKKGEKHAPECKFSDPQTGKHCFLYWKSIRWDDDYTYPEVWYITDWLRKHEEEYPYDFLRIGEERNDVDESFNTEEYPFYAKCDIEFSDVPATEPLDVRLYDWYALCFATDDLCLLINPSATFRDLWDYLKDENDHTNVYEIIGVGDSIIRERLFRHLETILASGDLDVTYESIYKMWLKKVQR